MAKRKKSYQYYPYPNLMPSEEERYKSDLEREMEVKRHLNTIHLYYP